METDIKEVKIYFKGEDKPFILDYEDLEKFLGCDPRIHYKNENDAYLSLYKRGRTIDFSRVLLNYYKRALIVDHINRNSRDYRKANLELKNTTENAGNRSKRLNKTTSRYKGVSWHKAAAKWQSKLNFYGKSIWIGLFDSEVEAAKAYDKMYISLYKTEHGTNKSLGLYD